MEQAYATALLPNQKHPHRLLQKLLVPLTPAKARPPQSADEMLVVAKRWDAVTTRRT